MVDEYLKAWLIKANNDYRAALTLFDIENPEDVITDAVCFHCQQAVEKFLKAFLICNNSDFKKTHNLDYLLQLCIEKDNDFSKLILGDLQNFAVQIRYPDEFYIPDIEETKESVEITETVKHLILEKINVKEKEFYGK